MKTLLLGNAVLIASCLALAAQAAELAAPVRITAGGKPIDVPGFAAPCVADFDGDGQRDLLVGQLDYGRLRIYHNSGDNARPAFDDFEWFKAGGHVAGIPAGCAVGFTPQLVDFDGDGRTDIVTGSFVGGVVFVYRRQADGTFAAAEPLENREGRVQLGRFGKGAWYNSTVFVHDWDEDGLADLLLGRSSYVLVPNTGTRKAPIFDSPAKLTANGEPLASSRVAPCVADWDGDGRPDLVAGKGADIVWYPNTGMVGRPALQPPRVLVSRGDLASAGEKAGGPDEERTAPSLPYAVCVCDYNADGRPDLLLGDHYYRPREPTKEEQARYADASKKWQVFWREYQSLLDERPEGETRQERIAAFRAALDQWRGLSDTPWVSLQASPSYERHGGVWFYQRLAK